eukprot:gene9165-biopygen9174
MMLGLTDHEAARRLLVHWDRAAVRRREAFGACGTASRPRAGEARPRGPDALPWLRTLFPRCLPLRAMAGRCTGGGRGYKLQKPCSVCVTLRWGRGVGAVNDDDATAGSVERWYAGWWGELPG